MPSHPARLNASSVSSMTRSPSIQPFIAALPTGALGEILRHWTTGGITWASLLVLVVWAVISHLIARKAFRWTS